MKTEPAVRARSADRRRLSQEAIAAMSNRTMADLPREDLVAIVELVRDHLPQQHWVESTDQCDEATLLRMAFQARECCRHLIESGQACRPTCNCEGDDCGCPHCT